MTDRTPSTAGEPDDNRTAESVPTEEPQTFTEAFSAAMRQSNFSKVNPDETPTFSGMLSVVGGVRGLIESFLPGLVFLVLFSLTKELLLSVLVPVGVAVVLIVIRAITRAPLTPAISGAIGIALTALLSIVTNRPENNFLPGILINSGVVLVLLISLIARWPFVGVVVGFIMGDHPTWRDDALKRRALTFATVVWLIPSLIRIAIQVPLYLTQQTEWLAGTKLITGLPLYAAALWITWLLVRRVYTKQTQTQTLDTP